MENWSVTLEIFVPSHEYIPHKIAQELHANNKEPLDNSVSLQEYVQWIQKCIQSNPRRVFPKLRSFQSIVVYPWEEIPNEKDNIKTYISKIRASRWTSTIHPPYTLGIRLTFRQS